tara:strand:- start:1675 stop:2112 length:438 start_codon:yes stop_codon:yes gene_type:complete
MKILIMGLPGSGKTTLAKLLAPMFNAIWLNADEVRKEANDWDFSEQGRIRQANRMNTLAKEAIANNRIVVADFVCPTEKTRKDFNADYTIFMDTIKEGRYDDTNKMFEVPKDYDFRIEYFDATQWAFLIKQDILAKDLKVGVHDK